MLKYEWCLARHQAARSIAENPRARSILLPLFFLSPSLSVSLSLSLKDPVALFSLNFDAVHDAINSQIAEAGARGNNDAPHESVNAQRRENGRGDDVSSALHRAMNNWF